MGKFSKRLLLVLVVRSHDRHAAAWLLFHAKESPAGLPPPPCHPNVTRRFQIRIRTLLRENAECHAQIRLLGAKVFELSEALEAIGKGKQAGSGISSLELVSFPPLHLGLPHKFFQRPAGRWFTPSPQHPTKALRPVRFPPSPAELNLEPVAVRGASRWNRADGEQGRTRWAEPHEKKQRTAGEVGPVGSMREAWTNREERGNYSNRGRRRIAED
uniref:Uncharacterized protein n=1 Tax=Guillardia theta TaxID=55529 RepID=A0A7S4L9G0_GUITH|mmetsp:Transcript_40330/g.126932  ORF Transcript_40330/g.126932 Transcript_40330/m.126932 type:complete len:215 (+) Transcript_40330:592-1236(+)